MCHPHLINADRSSSTFRKKYTIMMGLQFSFLLSDKGNATSVNLEDTFQWHFVARNLQAIKENTKSSL